MKNLIFLISITLCFSVSAQLELPADKEQYFDFWVGKWSATWDEGEGKIGKGVNTITTTMDGKSIVENFEILEGSNKGFKGTSLSMYVPRRDKWKQVWNDNQQTYYDFTGEFDGDKRIFITDPLPIKNNKTIVLRMVFYDIKSDSFTWDWQSSNDGGETWNTNWQILYERIEEPVMKLSEASPDFSHFIGRWNCTVANLDSEGNWAETEAEWEWKSILDGKAIQDYWNSPDMMGTNIRIFNPKTNNWMNAWVNNKSMAISEVWQANTLDNGSILMTDAEKSFEIHFYNIEKDSFEWKWDVKQADGTLKTVVKIKGNRVKA